MGSHPIEPAQVAPPAARYALGVHTTDATRWVHTSGIVPIAPDGTVADDLAEQAAEVWRSIAALLADAEMDAGHVVSVTTYVVPGQDLGVVMAARDRFMGDHVAASTLVVVAALARPEWLVEAAVVAAAP